MCFLQVPPSYCVKGRLLFFTSFSIMGWFTIVLCGTRVSIKTLGSSYLVYIMLCNVSLSVLHQTFFSFVFGKQQIAFILFVGWKKKKNLFMWPILYFLILFISYCCVQYYRSSIYRYILVKRNMVLIIGQNLRKESIYCVLKHCEMRSLILFYFISSIFHIMENSKFGNFYTIVKTLYFQLKKKKFHFLHLCFFF